MLIPCVMRLGNGASARFAENQEEKRKWQRDGKFSKSWMLNVIIKVCLNFNLNIQCNIARNPTILQFYFIKVDKKCTAF